jgi:protein-tyrosine phosphatase
MVDIHCHILPAVDDGAAVEEMSQEMAQMAAADGITHLVATPHASYSYEFDPGENLRKRDELQRSIGTSINILLGCDFHLSEENLQRLSERPGDFTLNARQYLLVEFSNTSIPAGIGQIFSDLLSRNLRPIITHPERNPLLAEDYERIRKWMAAGGLVQVTAGAVLGRFGKRALRSARVLLRHRMVHFLATDAHNTTSRPPLLSEARGVIAAECGEAVAQALCEENPRAAIEGRDLPWRPDPEPVHQRKSWFSLHR